MKLTCEYCGSVFETNDNPVCPQCASEYGDNPEYQAKKKEERAFLEQRRKLLLERQRINNEQARKNARNPRPYARPQSEEDRARRVRRIGCLIPAVIVGVILIISAVFSVLRDQGAIRSSESPEQDFYGEEEQTLPPMTAVSGGFAEVIETPQYAVRVTEIRETDGYPWDCPAGHTFVLIHVLLENRTDTWIDIPDTVHCVADGIVQQQYYTPSDYRRFGYTLDKGLTAEGWYQFDVPDDAREMEFRFGDYVTCRFTWADITPRSDG